MQNGLVSSPQSPQACGHFPSSPVTSPYAQYPAVYSNTTSPVYSPQALPQNAPLMSRKLDGSGALPMNCINISMPAAMQPAGAAPMHIRCCDPYNQKVYDVPQYLVEDTMGKQTYTNNPSGRRAQICMKFQNGQCNMKARCQQIHADRAWVHDLRSKYIESRKVYVSDILAMDLDSGERLAFKYSEVDNCPAKDKYRQLPDMERFAVMVCKEYVATNACSNGRGCPHVHVPPEKYAKVLTAHMEKKEQTRTRAFSPQGIASPTSPISPSHSGAVYNHLNLNLADLSARSASPISPSNGYHMTNNPHAANQGLLSPSGGSHHDIGYPTSPVYSQSQSSWNVMPQPTNPCWSPTAYMTSPTMQQQHQQQMQQQQQQQQQQMQPAVVQSPPYYHQPHPHQQHQQHHQGVTSPHLSGVIVPASPPHMPSPVQAPFPKRSAQGSGSHNCHHHQLPPPVPEHPTFNANVLPVVVKPLASLVKENSFSNMSTPRGLPHPANGSMSSSGAMRGRSLSRTSLAEESSGLHSPTSRSHSAPPVHSPSDGDLSIDSSVGNASMNDPAILSANAGGRKLSDPAILPSTSCLGSELRLAQLKSQRSRSLNNMAYSGRN
ncbi:hypothetical protein DIPPA_11677 [Diplonema papillatum]|nr:hypothetical protein DIPPA_11677 [Diplonema papillatum]